jgi:spoIIIJ-associated protein
VTDVDRSAQEAHGDWSEPSEYTTATQEDSVVSMTDGPIQPDEAGVAADAPAHVTDTADTPDAAPREDDARGQSAEGDPGEHEDLAEGGSREEAGASETADESEGTPPRSQADLLEREGEVAADYIEGLLDIVDADGDIDMDVEGDRAVVSVIGDRLRHLVGPRGTVLEAIQDLTRLAVAQETGVRSRLMLDIGGYRARRRAELAKIGTQAAQQAAETGEPVTLEPMTAFERKVVHDAVAAAGQTSESEGVEPERRVVVLPAGGTAIAAPGDDDAGPDASDRDSAAREPAQPNP